MKIVLVTFGSRGDVQPMLALSLALKKAGHEVLLCGPPEKAEWAHELGCPYQPFGNDITAFLDEMNDAYSVHSSVQFIKYMRRELPSQFDILHGIISGADLTIGSSLAFALSSCAEASSIPYRYIAFTPQLFPSKYHPFFALRQHWLPPWGNRITWNLALFLDRFNLTKLINLKRIKLGLEPVIHAWFHILGDNPVIACDGCIAKAPPDVESSVTQTGYLHLDQPAQQNIDLENFLQAGLPPVYAGFGSMPKNDQAKCVPIIVKAARDVGRRAVISKFWDEPSEYEESDDVFFIQKYPHLKLFPSMAAVIHHGGAGTTASSAFSGVPQIIIPHALDQYYWGHKVYKTGLGPRPIWRSRLTSKKLAHAISECLINKEMQQNAKVASGSINPRESIEKTVNEILKV